MIVFRFLLNLCGLAVLALTLVALLVLFLGKTAADSSGVAPSMWLPYLEVAGLGGTISWLFLSSARDLKKRKSSESGSNI
jgi:hypothetical protein